MLSGTVLAPETVLPSNVREGEDWHDSELDAGEPLREAYADVAAAGGMLALLVTALVTIGQRVGGPPPTHRLWISLVPLLLLPMAILLGLLVLPSDAVSGRVAGWQTRLTLGLVGCVVFGATLLLLNLPTLLR